MERTNNILSKSKITLHSIVLLLFTSSSFTTSAGTDTLPISNGPLTVNASVTGVDPNVMLLMDNSGSMTTMMWSDDYIADIMKTPRPTYGEWDSGGNWIEPWNDNPQYIKVTNGNAKETSFTGTLPSGKTKTIYLPTPYGSSSIYNRDYLKYLLDKYDGRQPIEGGTAPDGSTIAPIPTVNRMDAAIEAAQKLVTDPMNSKVRFGLYSFSGLQQSCNSNNASAVNTAIGGLNPSGGTPLAETYYDIVNYFKNGRGNNPSPIQYRCQQNFVVALTDGFPTGDNSFPGGSNITEKVLNSDGTALINKTGSLPDWDGLPTGNDITVNDFLNNNIPPFSDGHGQNTPSEGKTLYLDDLALYGYEIDLKPTGNDAAGKSFNEAPFLLQNLSTYTIGFTIDNQMLRDAGETYGHGAYYTAYSGNDLSKSLQAAINNISQGAAALRVATPVTLSSGYLGSDTKIFYADYTAGLWSGSIGGYLLNPNDGSINTNTNFSLTIPTTTSARSLYTIKGSDGIAFQWTNLNTAQQTALCGSDCSANDTTAGQNRLNYLRGDQTKEESNGGSFRNRTTLLGDIVNSSMIYIKESLFRYTENDYVSYKETTTAREPMLYVGANDGMLHAFDVSDGVYKESFAYIPNEVFPNLKNLADPSYDHNYYVDGTPTVGDVFYNNQWHTILVGGLNKGGQGIYALDIGDPDNFDSSDVLWEFTDDNDSDLGYTYSRPAIVKMANGKWAAVFGNGYNNTEQDGSASTTGNAALYIAFIEDGINGWTTGEFVKIAIPLPAGETSNIANGLATVAPIDLNGDFVIDRIYAGDIVGNLWRIDVTSSTPSDWTNSANTTRLFVACKTTPVASGCPVADRQPITTRPEVGRGPTSNSVLVYFGTGKFLTDSDPTDTTLQTFYAVKDDGTTNVNRSALQPQTITNEYDTSTTTQSGDNLPYRVRVTSSNTVDYVSKKGWYMDLIYDNDATGERVIYNPILRNGKIIFVTNYYTTTTTTVSDGTQNPAPVDACTASGVTASGKGWLMELDALMGSRLAYTPFDVNGDRKFDSGDYVDIGNGTGSGNNEDWVPVSGRQFDGNIASPGIVTQNNFEIKYNTQSSGGGIQKTEENPGAAIGRQSWRQLK